MKRILSVILLITFVVSSFSFLNVYAETYDDYRDVYWYDECGINAKKPTAGFRIVAPNGNSVKADDGGELEVRLGDTVRIMDESIPGSGSLDRYDFQVYCKRNDSKSVIKEYSSLPSSWVMSEEGIWDFYLCVRDDTPLTKGWTNWSDNGSRQVRGYNNMWWYFVHVRVNVLPEQKGEITVYYKDIDTDEDLYLSTYMANLSYKTYSINAKPAPSGYKLLAQSPQQVKISASELYKEVFFYYQNLNSDGGTIIAYYKDKVTKQDIMSPDTYSGMDYGEHEIYAQDAPDGYTLETVSPQVVTISKAAPFKEVIFLYKGDGSMYGKPPCADVYAPSPVMAGDEIEVTARSSYDPDGRIVNYAWDLGNAIPTRDFQGKVSGYIWFEYEGSKEIGVTVTDNDGMTGSDYTEIEVLPPIPTAKITYAGTLMQNRLVTLSSTSSKSPKHYPIDHTRTMWEITPVSGGNVNDIKYSGSLVGTSTKDVLFKKPGKYKVKLTVYNTYEYYDYSDTTETILDIIPDNPPIANFSVPSKYIRDPEDSNKVRIELQDHSYSDDGDIISRRLWKGSYDSNNDGNFNDESWIIIDDGNNTAPVVITDEVGKWKYELEIEEEFGQPTIAEFITEADKRYANTLKKKEDEKIIDVVNTAPIVDFEMKKKKPVDLIVVTDYEGQKLSNLQSSLTALKTEINALNLDFNYTILSSKVNIGVVNDAIRKYLRYARYTNICDVYISQSNGDREIYGASSGANIFWEETTRLESDEMKLPVRNPLNISWSKSSEYYHETKTHDQWRFDINVSCTNDVKTNGSTPYTTQSWNKKYGYGDAKDNIRNEKVTIDKKFNKGDIIEEIITDLNVLDVDEIFSVYLRDNSDRYLVMSTNDYYGLGNLTENIREYVTRNNFKVKAVMNEAIRDMLVTNEKIWDIETVFGETYYYLKNGKILRTGNESYAGGILYPVDVTEKLADVKNIEIIPEAQAALYFKSNGQVLIQYATEKTIDNFPLSNIKEHKYFNNTLWYFLTNNNKLYLYSVYNKSLSSVSTGTCVIDKILSAEHTFLTTDGKVVFRGAYGNPFTTNRYNNNWYELNYLDNTPVTNIKELTPAMTNKENYINSNRILKNNGIVVNAKNEVILTNVKNMTYIKNAVLYEMNSGTYKIEAATFDYAQRKGPKDDRYYVNIYKLLPITDLSIRDIKEIYSYVVYSLGDYVGYSQGWRYLPTYSYYILCNDGSLYVYSWYPNSPTYTDQSAYYYSSLPTRVIETNVSQMGAGLTKVRLESTAEPQRLIPYYLYKDGTVKRNRTVITGLTNIKKISVPYLVEPNRDAETTVIALNKDGTVKGMGNSSNGELGQFNSNVTALVNPLNNRVVLNDYSKSYIKPNDLIGMGIYNKYYAEDQYQNAIDDILNEIKAESTIGTQCILLGEKISYESFYNDYENDPKYRQVWRYEHDSNYFENGLGAASFSGKDIDNPIEQFDKIGKFKVTLKARDNPKDMDSFDNYRLWNKNDSSMILYVHRKPVAQMNVNVTPNANNRFSITVEDGGSYDLDHISLPNKGIIEWDWRWKEANDYDWHYEKINISDGTSAKTYIIMLRVKDMEGAWSDPIYQIIDETAPPKAQFYLQKSTITTDELPKIKDTSFAVMSDLTNWHWIVKKINENGTVGSTLQDVKATSSNTGAGGYDTSLNLTRTNPGVGKYRIYLGVKADNGLWSDGGTDAAPNINNMFYRDLTVNQALSIGDISITGRWNHFRGWTDKFGVWKDIMKDTIYRDEKGVNRYPYRFLSYEMIDVKIKLEGYADEVIIDFPVNSGSGYSLGSMHYKDRLGYEYSYEEDLGYTVNFPYKGPFKKSLNPAEKDPTIEWSYILPLVHSSASWENNRLYQPYEIKITAKKGNYEVTQTKKIDITGNVDDLIFIQPVAR